MTVRERILSLKLLEKTVKMPEYAEKIGIQIETVKRNNGENNV